MTRRRFEIPNRIEALPGLARKLEKFGRAQAVPVTVLNDLNVALDEIVANVISHGYTDTAEHAIVVEVTVADGAIAVEVTDDGIAFNPLAAPAPDLGGSLRERRVGGVGIHFVRRLTDDCCYRRVDGKNHLRMTRRVDAGGR
jgi:serine/threonine-protein kinase RsbW